jgi:hypothetical protein
MDRPVIFDTWVVVKVASDMCEYCPDNAWRL